MRSAMAAIGNRFTTYVAQVLSNGVALMKMIRHDAETNGQ